ncbi:spore germination protein [Brevibacillus fluminis]|uniref:spore germination protein n=1 Tax=Brevibacillus fluminis TaxID=511487 RepID=UPI003F89B38D
MSIWNWWRTQAEKRHGNENTGQDSDFLEADNTPITRENVRERLSDMDDLVVIENRINGEDVTVIYINTLIKKLILQELIFDPLQKLGVHEPGSLFPLAETICENEFAKLVRGIVAGGTVLFFHERNLILLIDTNSMEERSITTSESESTIMGPQDSFTESLETSVSLIRRRIVSSNLKVRAMMLGTETNSHVVVMYMENLANPENVERALYRLKNIEFQGFVGLPILKQMIEDKPYSPFPQLGITSRPDNAVAGLLNGRIIIMINGSPDAIICPSTFLELFNSPEDFYTRWSTATMLRLIRFSGLFISVLLTSSYVSVLTYHPEMLPPQLLLVLTESRSKVPFPPVIEVMFIEIIIEILREAGARMPSKIGQTIGIVGGIVIGTASVQAGLASNILIVIVSISALLSFVTPTYLLSNAIRVVRYLFILGAGSLGMYGQMLALALLFAHLLNLTSLGSPYMTPVIPRDWGDLANSLFRAPIGFILSRSGMSRAKKQLSRPLDEE